MSLLVSSAVLQTPLFRESIHLSVVTHPTNHSDIHLRQFVCGNYTYILTELKQLITLNQSNSCVNISNTILEEKYYGEIFESFSVNCVV